MLREDATALSFSGLSEAGSETVWEIGSSERPYLVIRFMPKMDVVTEGETTNIPWSRRP